MHKDSGLLGSGCVLTPVTPSLNYSIYSGDSYPAGGWATSSPCVSALPGFHPYAPSSKPQPQSLKETEQSQKCPLHTSQAGHRCACPPMPEWAYPHLLRDACTHRLHTHVPHPGCMQLGGTNAVYPQHSVKGFTHSAPALWKCNLFTEMMRTCSLACTLLQNMHVCVHGLSMVSAEDRHVLTPKGNGSTCAYTSMLHTPASANARPQSHSHTDRPAPAVPRENTLSQSPPFHLQR